MRSRLLRGRSRFILRFWVLLWISWYVQLIGRSYLKELGPEMDLDQHTPFAGRRSEIVTAK